jgi:nucleotide-binding universal stress UspA family protein
MYKKMVVLLDGSELAERVFEYAQELSGRMHIDVELLHVCKPHETELLPMRRGYMERMAEELCTEAEKVSSKYGRENLERCINARGHVVVGYPAEEILKYVDENDIDLIMMSTHGSSGIRAWDLGGVANKVIHASTTPIWLVPSELREDIVADTLSGRNIVIPLDGSKGSEAVIPHAINVRQQRGAEGEIVLLQVRDVAIANVVSRAALEEHQERLAQMKAYLEGVAQTIRETGLTVRTEVLTGDPATTIIRYLKDNPAHLLAMSTRGRIGLSRMIFGSVAESVIRLVKHTPLLLVAEEA